MLDFLNAISLYVGRYETILAGNVAKGGNNIEEIII